MSKKIIKGEFLYYDRKNLNDRIYPKKIAEKIVKQFNKTPAIFLGELDHPEDRFELNLNNVSHMIEEIHLNEERKCIEGTIRILNTPKGKILSELIDAGILNNEEIVLRPRGTGCINENGEVENYQLYTFDVVAKDKDSFRILPKIKHLKF